MIRRAYGGQALQRLVCLYPRRIRLAFKVAVLENRVHEGPYRIRFV